MPGQESETGHSRRTFIKGVIAANDAREGVLAVRVEHFVLFVQEAVRIRAEGPAEFEDGMKRAGRLDGTDPHHPVIGQFRRSAWTVCGQ